MRLLFTFVLAVSVFAEDPAMLARDGKDSAAIQKLLLHQQIDQAKIQAILAKYAATHNCPSHQATIGQALQLSCVPLPSDPPKPAPTKEK